MEVKAVFHLGKDGWLPIQLDERCPTLHFLGAAWRNMDGGESLRAATPSSAPTRSAGVGLSAPFVQVKSAPQSPSPFVQDELI